MPKHRRPRITQLRPIRFQVVQIGTQPPIWTLIEYSRHGMARRGWFPTEAKARARARELGLHDEWAPEAHS